MGEEVGELFKAVRRVKRFYDQEGDLALDAERRQQVAEELVDVLNYLLAIANRLDINLEQAFIDKNSYNQQRVWHQA
jgi:NTP pyrophosphatase (non-canonical NTP hydrolase)